MSPSHSNWNYTQLEQVVPVDGGKTKAVALAQQLQEAGHVWRLVVLLLNADGDAIAASDWLPIGERGNASRLIVTGEQSAMVVVTERISLSPLNDRAVWFVVQWSGSTIEVCEIGRWSGMKPGLEFDGRAHNGSMIFAGTHYPDSATVPTQFGHSRLFIGRSQDDQLSEFRQSDLEAVHVSGPVWLDGRFFILVTSNTFERVELCAIDAGLSCHKVAELDRRKNKHPMIGPARMARFGDALIMVWATYQDRVGPKSPRTWQGNLRAASYRLWTETLSPACEVTGDDKVVAATLQVHAPDDSVIVTRESRPKQDGGMRADQFGALEECHCDPFELPEKSERLFMPWADGPVLRVHRCPESSSWVSLPVLPE